MLAVNCILPRQCPQAANEAALIGCKHTNLNHMVFRYAVKLSCLILNDDTLESLIRLPHTQTLCDFLSSQHLFYLLHEVACSKMQRPAKQSRKTSAENVCDSAKTWARLTSWLYLLT